MLDLFTELHDEAKLHPQFKLLRDREVSAPARAMLTKVCEDLEDPDGNLVEQFQTFGFDARTFEIFLYAMFKESGHAIDRSHDRPDFGLSRDGVAAWVEAVTANPTPTGSIDPYAPFPGQPFDYKNAVPIKLGSPLFSKLKKKYWNLPHVVGKPLVFALQDFHAPGSLTNSSAALAYYLFGIDQSWHKTQDGKLIIDSGSVKEHSVGSKRIPSGFFSQPDAENVSAVLFCNSGTIPKFGRMGQQGQYRSPKVRMLRYGTKHRFDVHATLPEAFLYEVGDPELGPETWREGTILIRNPNALRPLPPEWLGAAAEEDFENGQVMTTFAEDFLPFMSVTQVYENASDEILKTQAEAIVATLTSIYPP